MSDFRPLEVVGRGSETQLQVGEALNKLTIWANMYMLRSMKHEHVSRDIFGVAAHINTLKNKEW